MDETLLLLINGLHNEYWDGVVMATTYRFTWIPLYVVMAYCIMRSEGWKNGLLAVIGIALTIVIADQAGAGIIRPLAERLRPTAIDNPLSQHLHIVDGYRGGRYGMPSCHAANTVGLVAFLALRYRHTPFILMMSVWAMIQMYTRLYLGVHYPTDILAGIGVGLFAALVSHCLWHLAYRRLNGEAPRRERLSPAMPVFVVMAAYVVFLLCQG